MREFDGADGPFGVDSKAGLFRCRDCVACDVCRRPLTAAGVGPDAMSAAAGALERRVVKCVGCNHSSIHATCERLPSSPARPPGVSDVSADDAVMLAPVVFRCECCRTCAHCGVFRVPIDVWDEPLRACAECTTNYLDGAVCPVCDRAYRDDEDNLILCDLCEKWVHGRSCSGLDEEAFAAADRSDDKYVCPRCSKRNPAKRPRRKRTKSDTSDGRQVDPDEGVLDEGGLLSAVGEAEDYGEYVNTHDFAAEALHDVAMYAQSRASKGVRRLGVEFAPQLDVCRRCGSGGGEMSLRFCADCGDAVHGFCLPNALPRREASCDARLTSAGSLARLTAGGLGVDTLPWRCDKCEICKLCGGGAGGRDEGDPATLIMIACDHCACAVHEACAPVEQVSGEADPPPTFRCSDCRTCDLCMAESNRLERHAERLFCADCLKVVRAARPCSACAVPYPAAPAAVRSVVGDCVVPAVEGVSSAARAGPPRGPVAQCCRNCQSLVHVQCDAAVGSGDASYTCALCKEGAPFQPPEHPAAGFDAAASPSTHGPGGLRGSGPRTVGAADSPREHLSPARCRQARGPGQDGDDCESVEVMDSGGSDVELGVDDQSLWPVATVDDRVCEFCGAKERPNCSRGRLLPWTSGRQAPKLWWVHAMCAVWSSGVVRVFPTGAPWVSSTCFLVADRRWLLQHARENECSGCGGVGATLGCAEETCRAHYHYACAEQAGCRMLARTVPGEDARDDTIDLCRVTALTMYCGGHSGDESDLSTVADDCSSGSVTLSVGRRLNLHVPIRFSCSASQCAPRTDRGGSPSCPGVRLRTGGLMVLSQGQLVPNSSLFFEGGALVPTQLRVARRHWSLKHPGGRCTYLMETSGSARTGPRFTIRAADDPDMIICAQSAAVAWGKVAAALESIRVGALGEERATELSLVECSGADAFGLSNCDASVSWIESLPLSFLMRGRYTFLHGDPQPPKDLPFAVPRMSSASPPNTTGGARVEGYVPRRHPLAWTSGEGARSYENVPSGERFQVHVAMGLGRAVHEEDGGGSRVNQRLNVVAGRPKPRGAVVGEDSTRAPSSSAHLPHAMQHRAMLKTWMRRTVVLRSGIEGWGVFATEDIVAGDMVIEYMGEIIRPIKSDRREEHYDSLGIGCYMFEISPGVIADATRSGNRARYINHSCDPNCYSRTVAVENGRRAIVIFAKRNVRRGEELCYDYKFPLDEEDRVACACGAAKCQGFMN
jgi:hypothetical protein